MSFVSLYKEKVKSYINIDSLNSYHLRKGSVIFSMSGTKSLPPVPFINEKNDSSCFFLKLTFIVLEELGLAGVVSFEKLSSRLKNIKSCDEFTIRVYFTKHTKVVSILPHHCFYVMHIFEHGRCH